MNLTETEKQIARRGALVEVRNEIAMAACNTPWLCHTNDWMSQGTNMKYAPPHEEKPRCILFDRTGKPSVDQASKECAFCSMPDS